MYEIFNLSKPEEKLGWQRRLRSMFGKESQEKARMVLVEGNPCIGKTTFCLKIANDWARQAIPKKHDFPLFKLMLLLKCRDMDGDVMQAINDQLLPEDIKENEKKVLLDYIKNEKKKKDKILIILDGLDELPQVAEQYVNKLLRGKVLSHCSVLATSRQEKGIEIRQCHVFDTLLQINGYTIEDASEYIRKHFQNVDPVDLFKGESLIQAIQENMFLHALRNNPLNLVLLCVVFEDHEGELPSNRTKLYQIIYHCLLRRFCSKNKIEVDKDDISLEKRFEDSMLILGELAWRCLLEERPYFLQEELDRLEKLRTNGKGISASKVGLVFMEASVKKINPKDQYHFLHRTFQEFLAAAYLALKMMKENISVFDMFELDKSDITSKYWQVFLFVAGILGKDGAMFFKQFGEIMYGNWNCHQLEGDCHFLFQLLDESGAANDLATVVCRSINLPQNLELSFKDQDTLRLVRYAHEASSVASNVEPLQLNKLSLTEAHALHEDSAGDLLCILENNKTLKDLVISTDDMTTLLASTLLKGLSSNSSLSSFTLKPFKNIRPRVANTLGTLIHIPLPKSLELNLKDQHTLRFVRHAHEASLLASNVTPVQLNKLSLTEAQALQEDSASDLLCILKNSKTLKDLFICTNRMTNLLTRTLLEGLSSNSSLSSFSLKPFSSIPPDVAKMLLSKSSLISFSLTVFGDMEDRLASALSEGLSAKETTLNCFSVVIHGSLSNHGAALLAEGVLENRSLHSLTLEVLGDVPEHWTGVVDKIHVLAASKSWKSLVLHPNMQGKFEDSLFSFFHPISRGGLLEKTFTINMWGELSIRNVEVLGDQLLQTLPLSSLTLKVNGKVGNNVADCLVNFFVANNVRLSLTINLSGEISSFGQTALQRLRREGQLQSFILNMDGLVTDWECSSAQKTSSALSIDIRNTTPNEVSEIFSGSKSLTELSVAVHNHDVGKWRNWAYCLGKGLAQIKSLTSFTLTVHNYAGSKDSWGYSLVNEGLSNNKSLTSFILTVHNHPYTEDIWGYHLAKGLSNNKSLTKFSLTVHNYTDTEGSLGEVLHKGLLNNKSLTTFSLTVHNYADTMGRWGNDLGRGLSNNESLTTFSLTVHNYANTLGSWENCLREGLSNNKLLTTLSLTVHDYANTLGSWGDGLCEGLSNSKSLTTFNLTVHHYSCTKRGWGYGLGQGLSNNKSLTTFTLTVHNYAFTKGSRGYGLGEGLSNEKSLTTFSLIAHDYVDTEGSWGYSLGQGLSNSKSLTTFSLTVHDYADTESSWEYHLADSLAKRCSLTTVRLSINDHTSVNRDRHFPLCKSLEEIESLTLLSISLSLYGEDIVQEALETKF